MTALVIPVGIPGSGKSRWCGSLFGSQQIVSFDELRWRLTDDMNDQSANIYAVSIGLSIIAQRMSRGLLTVLDATNVRAEYRKGPLMRAREHRMPVVAVVFDYPLERCQTQNESRERVVPHDIVEAMHRAMYAELDQITSAVDIVVTMSEAGNAWGLGKEIADPTKRKAAIHLVRDWFPKGALHDQATYIQ